MHHDNAPIRTAKSSSTNEIPWVICIYVSRLSHLLSGIWCSNRSVVATCRQHVSTGLTSPITGFEPYRMNTDIKMRDMQKDGKGRPVMVLNAEVG